MFAVIRTGGKQYKVASGDVIQVEKLTGDVGSSLALGEVLMISDAGQTKVGTPLLSSAKVTAEIVAHRKTPKVLIFKKKRRHNYRRKKGHRQEVTVLRITKIAA